MPEEKEKKSFVRYLAVYGCISTGLIYTAIGVIAILSFLKMKKGGADESDLLIFLNDFVAGKIIIWIILLGTASYICWRFYEAFTDPYEYGKDMKGVAKRTGIALSTIADGLIIYSAIQALLKGSGGEVNGPLGEQQQMIAGLLQERWGNLLIICLGTVITITAAVQFFYGITKGYRERVNLARFKKSIKFAIHFLAWIGYATRGIILGIIGFFFIKAGVLENAQFVVNTDKAFDFIGDEVGHLFFILAALGTIFYGLFMFALGATYHTDE